MLKWIIVLVVWAIVGAPYGIKVYKDSMAAGSSRNIALLKGISQGIFWPVEQLVKRGLIPLAKVVKASVVKLWEIFRPKK